MLKGLLVVLLLAGIIFVFGYTFSGEKNCGGIGEPQCRPVPDCDTHDYVLSETNAGLLHNEPVDYEQSSYYGPLCESWCLDDYGVSRFLLFTKNESTLCCCDLNDCLISREEMKYVA